LDKSGPTSASIDQTRPEAIDQLIQRNAIGQIAIDEFNVVHAYIP
jgi:hypothetical protein